MNTHFTKLIKEESESKLRQLHRSDSQIVLWEKEKNVRAIFKTASFSSEDMTLLLKKTSNHKVNSGNKHLAHFSLNGLSFFFECQLKRDDEFYRVSNIENFYKAERRTSFRLLTYPHRRVFFKFALENVPKPKESNVVSIDSGESQTGLFINFLELMGESFQAENQDEPDSYDAELKLRVQDVSLTGLCFEIGEIEKKYLEKNKTIKDVKLEFDEVQIVIPEVKVVYIKEHENFISNMKNYRVGVEFCNMAQVTERLLNQKIKSYLKKIESEYEDILKK